MYYRLLLSQGKKPKPERLKVSGRSLYIVCLRGGKESKRKAAAKAVSNKETPARKKAKSSTSIDQAVKIIKRHIQPAEEDIAEEGLTLDEAVKGDVVPIIPL